MQKLHREHCKQENNKLTQHFCRNIKYVCDSSMSLEVCLWNILTFKSSKLIVFVFVFSFINFSALQKTQRHKEKEKKRVLPHHFEPLLWVFFSLKWAGQLTEVCRWNRLILLSPWFCPGSTKRTVEPSFGWICNHYPICLEEKEEFNLTTR